MERVLITGVAGFMGANIAHSLIKNENVFIYGIDDFSCSDVSALYLLLKSERFSFLEGDVSDTELPQVEKIIHLTGNRNFSLYNLGKFDFITKQIGITKKLFDYSKIFGSKLILTSQFVNKNRCSKNLYEYFDYLKLYDSISCDYVVNNKIDAYILKLPLLYGFCYSKKNFGLIENAIFSALSGKDIVIENDITDYFCYIDDVSNLITNLLKFDGSITNNIINEIVPNAYFDLKEAIEFIINYTKSNSRLTINNLEKITPTYSFNETLKIKDFNFSNNYKRNLMECIDLFKKAYFL